MLAAIVLASVAWDLYHSPKTISAAKEELKRRLGEEQYQSLIQPGDKPPLDYRNAPVNR